MCSGISSLGSATSPSGNSGKSRSTSAAIALSVGPARALAVRSDAPCCQQKVVEDRRRQPRLEKRLVEALEQQIAIARVLLPGERHGVRVGARLERPVEPPEPVRGQLL